MALRIDWFCCPVASRPTSRPIEDLSSHANIGPAQSVFSTPDAANIHEAATTVRILHLVYAPTMPPAGPTQTQSMPYADKPKFTSEK